MADIELDERGEVLRWRGGVRVREGGRRHADLDFIRNCGQTIVGNVKVSQRSLQYLRIGKIDFSWNEGMRQGESGVRGRVRKRGKEE